MNNTQITNQITFKVRTIIGTAHKQSRYNIYKIVKQNFYNPHKNTQIVISIQQANAKLKLSIFISYKNTMQLVCKNLYVQRKTIKPRQSKA